MTIDAPRALLGLASVLASGTLALTAGAGARTALPAVAATRHAAPILGVSETVRVVAGTVLVRVKGAPRFKRLSGAISLPDDSEVDATRGRVAVTVATPQGGRTATALAYSGRFRLHQDPTAPAQTHLILSQPLSGCSSGTASAAARHHHGARTRRLWVSEHAGAWGTSGRYVSTSVEGTRWLTIDECNRSEVRVAEGVVTVSDLIKHTTTTVSAGQSYLAAAPSSEPHTPPAPAFAAVYLDTLPRTGGDEVTPGLVTIAGQVYAHGIQMEVGWAMSTVEATYAIPSGAQTFTAVIGNDSNQTNSLWSEIPLLYEVFVDERRAAIAHALGSTSEPLASVSVAGGHTLKLVIINVGDALGGTRADWGDPLFS
jgi:hypothetical protein